MKLIVCQICGRSKQGMPGFESLACGNCAERTTDLNGNRFKFDTELTSHGILATHFNAGGEFLDSDTSCIIDNFTCKAIELRFGGVGIKIIS